MQTKKSNKLWWKPSQIADAGRIKLLLLGAGESGKSTIFKQMRIFMYRYPEETRLSMRKVIFGNIFDGFRLVMDNVSTPDQVSSDVDWNLVRNVVGEDLTHLTEELHGVMIRVFESEAFKEAFSRRSEFHLFDGFKYYAKRLREFLSGQAAANLSLCRRCPPIARPDDGHFEEAYLIDEVEFEMFDVGAAQRAPKVDSLL